MKTYIAGKAESLKESFVNIFPKDQLPNYNFYGAQCAIIAIDRQINNGGVGDGEYSELFKMKEYLMTTYILL